MVNPESRIVALEIVRLFQIPDQRPKIKIFRGEIQRTRTVLVDLKKIYRGAVDVPRDEKFDLKWQSQPTPKGLFLLPADVAILIVVQLSQSI